MLNTISQSPKRHPHVAPFCSSNSPKPKDSLLTLINKKEKRQTLIFKKLEAVCCMFDIFSF